MTPLIIEATSNAPEIFFDPDKRHFSISGVSRPEDVRSFYYPVLEWLDQFRLKEVETGHLSFGKDDPLNIHIKLKYFNSSSAKFLYDIFMSFGELSNTGQVVHIFWHYDAGDDDMLEAGEEMSEIAELPFEYVEN
ncbi:MAG: DUF1987 domain-containing protein [Bacteroidales bacterium]|nr:DUF1987 domain-containing protein [Bacteroidales bacterium]